MLVKRRPQAGETRHQLVWARIRIKTASPGGFPQIISLVPLKKRLLCTVNANQLVVVRLVLNSGFNVQLFDPVDVSTILVLTDRLRIFRKGGAGATVSIWPSI